MSRIPKCRPNRSQQLATNWYQRDMSSPKNNVRRKKVGTASSPRTSITQATQIQHATHTQMQTKPLTTTCNKFIAARHDIPQKGREKKKSWNRVQPKNKRNTRHTNATCHACPNADLTTHNNLQQNCISVTWDQNKKGRKEKKSWSRDKPKDKHNTSHTNTICHAYPNSDQTAHNNLQQIDISETWDPTKLDARRKKVGTATIPRASTTQAPQMQHVTFILEVRKASAGILTGFPKVSCVCLAHSRSVMGARYRKSDAHTCFLQAYGAPDCFIDLNCTDFQEFCSSFEKFVIPYAWKSTLR